MILFVQEVSEEEEDSDSEEEQVTAIIVQDNLTCVCEGALIFIVHKHE